MKYQYIYIHACYIFSWTILIIQLFHDIDEIAGTEACKYTSLLFNLIFILTLPYVYLPQAFLSVNDNNYSQCHFMFSYLVLTLTKVSIGPVLQGNNSHVHYLIWSSRLILELVECWSEVWEPRQQSPHCAVRCAKHVIVLCSHQPAGLKCV